MRTQGLIDDFDKMRIKITTLPLFDKPTQKKIKAFVWIFDAYDLIKSGQIDPESVFNVINIHQNQKSKQLNDEKYMTIKQWKDFIKHHEKFTGLFP